MANTFIEIEALVDNLPKVEQFLEAELEKVDCPMKAATQIGIAVEEIFVNIANYAYAPDTGMAKISIDANEAQARVTVCFQDQGVPYDPLVKEDPDISLSAEERQIGGLGIFMTKELMDDVTYEYKDGSNLLKLVKDF